MRDLYPIIAYTEALPEATYLQTLKETFADPSEALRIRRKDVNGNIITINYPVKGHYPGPVKVSNKLIGMLDSLPKTSSYSSLQLTA
jgi:hypothetical protein